MDLQLQGKSVLITGGSRGIGFACAVTFAAEGANVTIDALPSPPREHSANSRTSMGRRSTPSSAICRRPTYGNRWMRDWARSMCWSTTPARFPAAG